MLADDLLAWLRLLILQRHPTLRTTTPALLRLPSDHPHTADLITAGFAPWP
ncbi:hypothetical protein [Acrocarpospora catenulata]|uniref:hypothetical protein n=1 Tax=Acrocarpospora catenulata TaxID=2836182 RepID=UPI001BD9A4BE|nr:hypothetical protein [Acrocarpospora catenulata]